ncbi:MAG TPA: Tim44-like domain-containing protein [Usitatibacter sp.]|nr:Tim44-like domain-containing protein [Usitatibacter sp.]
MKRILSAFAIALAFGAASLDADAARRFGGGGNIGKQRATPMQRDATPAAPAAPNQAAPAKPAAAPAAAGTAAAAKPSFMSRWGGLLAGLGIGALLASLFGAQLGPIIGLLLAIMLGIGLVFLLYRLFAGKSSSAARPAMAGGAAGSGRPNFSGIGSGLRTEPSMSFESNAPLGASAATGASAGALTLPADIEPQAFLRVAKTSFIRLQAANDRGDLDDIRDFTTPEVYAEVAMQVKERGGVTQNTEVVNLDAQLVDFATEGGYDVASVRFFGLLRENGASNPEAFDEIWHVRRKAGDRKDGWLIAGIQQNG